MKADDFKPAHINHPPANYKNAVPQVEIWQFSANRNCRAKIAIICIYIYVIIIILNDIHTKDGC